MQQSLAWIPGVAVVAMGCGGSPAVAPVESPAPSEVQPATQPAPAPPEEAPGGAADPKATPAADPRETALATINNIAYGADVDGAYQRARIVASGLTESDFGLPPQQVKALAAVVSSSVDPSQCSMILREALRDSALKAVEARCGGFEALQKQVEAAPAKSRSAVLARACKLQLDPQLKLEGVGAWALLMGEVVYEELGGAASKEAQRSTSALIYVCSAEEG